MFEAFEVKSREVSDLFIFLSPVPVNDHENISRVKTDPGQPISFKETVFSACKLGMHL